MVGFTRVWTDESKTKWVDDVPLPDTPYEMYKSILDKITYVENMAIQVISDREVYLNQLCEVVSAGLYDRGNYPESDCIVQG
jgi:hypothetical protein